MKTQLRTPNWTRFAVMTASLGLMAGCGWLDKDDDDSSGHNKKNKTKASEIQTNITSIQPSGDGQVRVSYDANVEGASYKCMTVPQGASGGQWRDCPEGGTTVRTQPGTPLVFKVKAVSKDGVEAAQAASRQLPAGEERGPRLAELETKILNKKDLGDKVSKSSVTLRFGVSGGEVQSSDLTYECRREGDNGYSRCPDGDTYTFKKLEPGKTYSLGVRAAHPESGETAKPDQIRFTAGLGQLEIPGAQDLSNRKRGSISLGTDQLNMGERVMCAVDEREPQACGSRPFQLQLDRYEPGSHKLNVTVYGPNDQKMGATHLNFCTMRCDQAGSGTPGQGGPQIEEFQIGNYALQIPEGMRVTQYASTRQRGPLQFYQIMNYEDPSYPWVHGCGNRGSEMPFNNFKTPVSTYIDGLGQVDYCRSTPRQDVFKEFLTYNQIARNHLEVATIGSGRRGGLGQFEGVISINHFDTRYEWKTTRSRFAHLCKGKPVDAYDNVQVRGIDFFGRDTQVRLFTCVADLAGGLNSPMSEWWVGTFYITSQGLELPSRGCFAGGGCNVLHDKNLLEVTFMSQVPARESHDFAQFFTRTIEGNLREIVPLDSPNEETFFTP